MRSVKIILVVLFCAVMAKAETLEGLSRRIDDIVVGRNNGNQIKDLRVQDDATIGDDLSVGDDASVTGDLTAGTVTVSGKTQADGELEANGDVDINLGAATEEITIDQTNTVGASGVPSLLYKDARTGANANQTNEATVVLSAEGTYALAVTKGAVDVAGNVNVGGTITGAGRIASQSGSSGEVRLGYTAAYGWLLSTLSGGEILQFMWDYAATGGVSKASLSSNGTFAATTLQGSLAGTYISGTLCAAMPVSATYSTDTNAQVTIQAKDPASANLARATGFEFWFSTYAVSTLPSTNEIESFSVQNGDMRMYRDVGASPTYIAQTDANGLFRFNAVGITNGASVLTNYVHLLGPNGYYTNHVLVWTP